MTSLKKGDHVITSKGNHGKIISLNNDIAIVKIGYKHFEIEVQNLTNINDGSTFEVEYSDGVTPNKTTIFIKHGTVLFEYQQGYLLYKELQKLLKQKLNTTSNLLITKVLIP